MRNSLNIKKIIAALFSVVLLIAAIISVKIHLPFFCRIKTLDLSAHSFFPANINESFHLFQNSKHIFKMFAISYVLPMFLFAAGLFLITSLVKVNVFSNLSDFILNGKNWVWFLLVYFVLLSGLRINVMKQFFIALDEFSYLFQSQLLGNLQFYAKAPVSAQSFKCVCVVIESGKWFSKYTIGFPLLLAIPAKLKLWFLLNPLISTLTIPVVFYLAKEMFDKKTGILAAIITAFSPFFIFNSLPLYTHPTFLFFYALFITFYYKSVFCNQPKLWYLSSLCAGMALLIRPQDLALPLASIIIFSVIITIFDKKTVDLQKKDKILTIIKIIAGIIPIGMLQLIVNHYQTGNFLQFAFRSYESRESLGFGNLGHTPVKGIWNGLVSMTRLMMWSLPLSVEIAFLAFFQKKREDTLLIILALSTPIFYFFYYAIGLTEMGPRFYHCMIVPLSILTARGLFFIEERANKIRPFKSGIVTAYIAFSLIFILSGTIPTMTKSVKYFVLHANSYFIAQREHFGNKSRALIFIRSAAGNYSSTLTQNPADFSSSIVRAIYLDEESNNKVINNFPNRKPFTADLITKTGKWIFTPYTRVQNLNDKDKIVSFMLSAKNYANSVKDYQKAAGEIDRALELTGTDIKLLSLKAGYLEQAGELDKALSTWKLVMERDKNNQVAIFKSGLLLHRIGKSTEGDYFLNKFIKLHPDYKDQLNRMLKRIEVERKQKTP